MDVAKYSAVLKKQWDAPKDLKNDQYYVPETCYFFKSTEDRGFKLFKFKLWEQIKQDQDLKIIAPWQGISTISSLGGAVLLFHLHKLFVAHQSFYVRKAITFKCRHI